MAIAKSDDEGHVVGGVGLLAGRDQALVHREGHRVARLRAVEDDVQHRPLEAYLQVVGRVGRVGHGVSSVVVASSASTAAVSAPSTGPAGPRRTGVREKRIGEPTWRTGPSVGCSASQ